MLATRTLWEGVRVRSDNRHVVIGSVFPLAQNYDDAYRELNVWLRDTEQKVINLAPVPCDTVSLGNQQKTLKVSIEYKETMDCGPVKWKVKTDQGETKMFCFVSD